MFGVVAFINKIKIPKVWNLLGIRGLSTPDFFKNIFIFSNL